MTLDATRDQRGRLPVAKEDEPACGSLCAVLPGVTGCQATEGHPGPHRFYDDQARVEWRQRKP